MSNQCWSVMTTGQTFAIHEGKICATLVISQSVSSKHKETNEEVPDALNHEAKDEEGRSISEVNLPY